eukprot:Lankesteria_metandrocarpae@DN671_c0_g1_i1.p1
MAAKQILIADVVPDFTQESQLGPINLYEFLKDHYVVLFSHPGDFTPVCTTELGEVAKLKPEWDKRNVKVLGLSVDDVASHNGWIKDIDELMKTKVNYPILADADRSVATMYSMIHPGASPTLSVRTVYIIGPDRKLRLKMTYPLTCGRNFNEILRVIDSIQLSDKYDVVTPANWVPGTDVMVHPKVSAEDAKVKFPKGVTTVKPYFRTTPVP